MNYFTGCYAALLLTAHCFAAPTASSLPAGLIKVTEHNNPECVEYVIYQGDVYCSPKILDKTPVDPQLLSFEKQNVVFDHRPWKVAWGKSTSEIFTVEYIPAGEDIDHWSELVTTQFVPGLTTITPAQFAERFIADLKKSGLVFTTNTMVNQPDVFIFEFKVDKPSNLQQDEILRIQTTQDGLYMIHYAIKQANMSEENRAKWLENIKKSTIKKK